MLAIIHHAVAVLLAALSLVLCAGQGPAHGAELAWKPQRNVELVVGAQAGGSNDRFGRLLQKVLTEINGAASMTAVNKPGQGQPLAVAYVNSHQKDPHYLLILGSSWVTTAITTRITTTHHDLTAIMKLID